MVNKLISLEELNLLAVLCDIINHSCNDKIAQVEVKKSDIKGSKIVVKASIVNKWQHVNGRNIFKNIIVEKTKSNHDNYCNELKDQNNGVATEDFQ